MRRFQLVLIKPSRYDDDGYVVQWWRSIMPSNALACLYGIANDAARRQVLGPDSAIDITAFDEINTRVRIDKVIELIRRHDGYGLVGLVGVQSNQYPRALDLATPLRAAGIPVVIGGFHVSGCLAMLPQMEAGLQQALDMGVSLFAGEAEGRLEIVLRDAARGELKPIYNYLEDLPSIADVPTPYLPPEMIRRTLNHHSSFDAGRGCPFQCSFCTIINVQGRKSRRRTPDDVELLIRQYSKDNIGHFFITDDNFARNKDWEVILDRIIQLRERDGMDLRFSLQIDALAHKIPNFVEKAARAGVRQVFIGLENINPANLLAAKKRQNKITEYRAMLLAWKKARIVTYAGYILGFPADTPAAIRQDVEIIKKELPVDILAFYFLTPLPGSEDHKTLWQKGVWMDPDLNKYDLEHLVSRHQTMTDEEFTATYREVWDIFYSPDHVERIMRRGAAAGIVMPRLLSMLWVYSKVMAVEGLHPLQGGLIRRKSRRDRRASFPIEPAWSFYPRYIAGLVGKQAVLAGSVVRLLWLYLRIRLNPERKTYTDDALTPVTEADSQSLELFTHSEDARTAVEHTRKIAGLTAGSRSSAQLGV
jgi:radical SAM superfamily enzyme YgiQ (UPF0313 family)